MGLKQGKKAEESACIPPGYAHDLGIKTYDGRFSKLIKSNTPLPASASRTFITPEDNCKIVTIEIYEGEGERITDQALKEGRIMKRGKVEILCLPDHRKGEIEITVKLTMTENNQIGISIQVYHQGEKIKEIPKDLE